MPKHLTTGIELASSTALVIGAAQAWAPLGWLLAGALGLLFAFKVERS
jgi:hypothetical protein